MPFKKIQKYSIKYLQTESRTHQKDYPTWSNKLHLRDRRVVQYTKISNCNPPYKQIRRQKTHDYLIRYKKDLWQNPTPLHDENPGEINDTGAYLNKIMVICSKPKTTTNLTERNLKQFHKLRNKTRLSTLSIPIPHTTWSFS